MMAASIRTTLYIEAVMGSTATGNKSKKTLVRKKKESAKKKPARKAAPKKTKSPNKPVKKKTAKLKKAASKKTATRKKAVRKKSTAKAGTKPASKPAKQKDATHASGTTTRRTGKTITDATKEDSKSLSWMATQAASALKAVRANQSERAQTLLAKAEITPSTPGKHRKQTIPILEAVQPDVKQDASADMASVPASSISQSPETKLDTSPANTPASTRTGVIKPATSKTPETKTTPASIAAKQTVKEVSSAKNAGQAMSGETAVAQPEPPTPLSDKQPDEVKATASRDNATVRVEAMEKAQEKQAEVPPAQEAAQVAAAIATASSNRRPIRSMLLTGIIIFIGVLGARAWFSDDDTADIAATQSNPKTEQASPTTGKSAQEAIAAVTGKPVAKAATTNTQTDNWSPTARPGWPTPAVRQQPLRPADRNDTGAMTGKRAATGSRQVPAPQQHTGVTPQVSRPAAPRPGYYYPAYGYNPQQPVAPQPYYRPTYSRPSYLQ
jgi:hypothetical protein